MSVLVRRVAPLALLLALAGCGSKTDPNAPLAFVPADTPYVFANLEPLPQPVIDQWAQTTREVWPISLNLYRRMLDKAEAEAPDSVPLKAARALLDEISGHIAAGTAEALGIKGSTRMAAYGIGALPVLRLELADPAKLRAAVARVEAKAGAQLPKAQLGALEYWALPLEKFQLLAAIVDQQLVLSIAPAAASDDLRKQLFGLTRPARPLDPATLTTLNKRYGYLPYSSGYVDFVRLVDFIGDEADPQRRELAAAFGGMPAMDATCKAEVRSIVAKFPRFVAGYTRLDPKHMAVHAQLELEPTLAKEFAASLAAAPGTGAAAEGLTDFALALPVLKQKSFWLKQAKAVVEKPYACTELAELNASFAKLKQSLDATIPPPASDLAGLRLQLSKLEFAAGKDKPELAGKLVVALNNPAGAAAMAQLLVPSLKDLKLTADGKPVALPADLAPPPVPPLFVAMNDRALALSAGAGEEAGLGAFLTAPAAAEPMFLRMQFTGAMYGHLGSMFDAMAPLIPAEQRADIDAQKQLFALYEKWLERIEVTMTANDGGVALRETVEMR
ncbi:MAG: hypothetical protein BGP24_13945 [Lysobacterales bacterium 69-70]|nr:hypothetical protein [Xanthomonadaceae bacterium]ODU35198.1 MAG: hypothetical protein ABS97_04780 [Xanthomonadaceae bacterium SCN 69-320]ODV16404.1 MAG: hypothetical protein ABT27_20055 [Xanthomonadaceae bacterium SCN 69-25]OJY94097.1 MAG: hypothetical protein BGP24_13945 [Xanthomonadales bacterium 69-70]